VPAADLRRAAARPDRAARPAHTPLGGGAGSAAQGRVGVAVGGEAGARLLRGLGMPTSGDTVLRLVRRLPLPRRPTPRALGVDDWARRKGQTYGTILVDLERHRVVDLLPDRSAPTLADWLRRRRGIRTIARDRSTEYARGIGLGAPRAVQVADRWHLPLNLRRMTERWLAGAHGRLRRLAPIPGRPSGPARRTSAFPRSRAERAAGADSRARREALYHEVRRRVAAGEPLLAIGRRMGLARGTVRKFAGAGSFPERAARAPGPSILDPASPTWRRGSRPAARTRWRCGASCGGGASPGRRDRSTAGRARGARHDRSSGRGARKERGRRPRRLPRVTVRRRSPPRSSSLAWHLTRPRDRLTEEQGSAVARLGQDAEGATVARLVRRFADLLRGCCSGSRAPCRAPLTAFEGWLADASRSGVAAAATFAAGLRQDGAAVEAALTTPWSSGQTEGQLGKLKLLKRQSFGRSSFDLLRRRVLLSA
jgi:hypothetical protein